MAAFESPEFYVPHRPPILLIESVSNITNNLVVCTTRTGQDSPLAPFSDKNGRIPASFLMEIMAQTVAVWAGQERKVREFQSSIEEESGIGLLLSVRALKFFVKELQPDLSLKVEMHKQMQDGNVASFEGVVKNGDFVLSSGKITAFSPSISQLQEVFEKKHG
ncbi:MAG: hypothetical protein LUC43_06095 [Burkholderiales bacterium]|nr:hypothetical protein [Burkholderiales bacterium]